MPRRATVLVLALAAGAAAAGESKDAIKAHKWEIQPVPYRDEGRRDPFIPLVPLKAQPHSAEWRVRIVSLGLSSVVVGKRKVAVFKELHGPDYSYILVNGVLIGPDHKPIPGVAGTIEAINNRAEYRVVLKQGAEKVEYSMPNWELAETKIRKAGRETSGTAQQRNPSEGGSRQ